MRLMSKNAQGSMYRVHRCPEECVRQQKDLLAGWLLPFFFCVVSAAEPGVRRVLVSPLINLLWYPLRRTRRFHFETYWTKFEGFQKEVSQAWQQSVQSLDPLIIF